MREQSHLITKYADRRRKSAFKTTSRVVWKTKSRHVA